MDKKTVLADCLIGLLTFEDRFGQVSAEQAKPVCDRLAWHKVLPLAAALHEPTKSKHKALSDIFKTTILRNMIREEYYHGQVQRIFKALEKEKIAFMPFKGPFWLIKRYPAYHWRHIGDIDILLPKNHVRKATTVLMKLGYTPHILGKNMEMDIARRGELAFFPGPSDPNDVPVELHWDPMPSPRFLRRQFLRSDDFFDYTVSGQWRDLEYRQPLPEIQIMYLLLHATCQHQFMRFVHVTTLVHFIQAYNDLDWEQILNFAINRHACTPLYCGLEFVSNLWPLPIPVQHIKDQMKTMVPLKSRVLASCLKPEGIPLATKKKGTMRRKVFRAAMSW